MRYAERADYGFGNYRYFVGEPRSAMIGLYYTPKKKDLTELSMNQYGPALVVGF